MWGGVCSFYSPSISNLGSSQLRRLLQMMSYFLRKCKFWSFSFLFKHGNLVSAFKLCVIFHVCSLGIALGSAVSSRPCPFKKLLRRRPARFFFLQSILYCVLTPKEWADKEKMSGFFFFFFKKEALFPELKLYYLCCRLNKLHSLLVN